MVLCRDRHVFFLLLRCEGGEEMKLEYAQGKKAQQQQHLPGTVRQKDHDGSGLWTLSHWGVSDKVNQGDSHPRPARCETWYKSREADGIEGGIVEGARFGIWPKGVMIDGTQVALHDGARLQDSPFPGGVRPYLMSG